MAWWNEGLRYAKKRSQPRALAYFIQILEEQHATNDTMSDSDDDYVADDISDNDIAPKASTHGTRSAGPVKGAAGSGTRGGDTNAGSNRRRAAWEDIQRSWDTVVEGADGSINSTVEGLRDAGKRKR